MYSDDKIQFMLHEIENIASDNAILNHVLNPELSILGYDSEAQKFLNLINNYRTSNGLGKLSLDKYLLNASAWMSNDMLTKQCCISTSSGCTTCGHTDSLGRDMGTRLKAFGYPAGTKAAAGENIAWGSGGSITTAQQAFDLWKSSPPHNNNMLDASWVAIGISRSCNGDDCAWVTDFGDMIIAAPSGCSLAKVSGMGVGTMSSDSRGFEQFYPKGVKQTHFGFMSPKTDVLNPIVTMTPGRVSVAGWRASYYGSDGTNGHGVGQAGRTPAYWACVAKREAEKYICAKPGGIWVLGSDDNYNCTVPFAKPSGVSISNMTFDTSGGSGPNPEPYLTAFDKAGMEIILQIEPGNVDLAQAARVILNKYKGHSCVKGFGIDVEWWKSDGSTSNDSPIPASTVQSMAKAVHAIKSTYKVVIKHYNSSVLPKGMAGVTYLNDSCGFGSLNEAVTDYANWAKTFSGSEIGYQMLYIGGICDPDDHKWWGKLKDPEVQIINGVFSKVPKANIYSSYIADFSLNYTYPTCK